jgi:hypothetical protein
MNTCSVGNCPNKPSARGKCATHVQRQKLGVDENEKPIRYRMYFATSEERLNAYVNRGAPDECWEWTRAKSKGYGNLSTGGGKYRPAHIVAWELANGRKRPPGMVIRHSCDNRACCNPAHLLLGTQRDNMQDKVDRGRQPRGETMATSKLTQQQVNEIRLRYAQGGIRQKDLAAEYGTSQSNVSFLVRNMTWSN